MCLSRHSRSPSRNRSVKNLNGQDISTQGVPVPDVRREGLPETGCREAEGSGSHGGQTSWKHNETNECVEVNFIAIVVFDWNRCDLIDGWSPGDVTGDSVLDQLDLMDGLLGDIKEKRIAIICCRWSQREEDGKVDLGLV